MADSKQAPVPSIVDALVKGDPDAIVAAQNAVSDQTPATQQPAGQSQATQQVPVIDPYGNYKTLPTGDVQKALTQGWKLEDPKHEVQRKADEAYSEAHPIRSMAQAVGQGTQESLPGKIANYLPSMALEKAALEKLGITSPEEREQAARVHPTVAGSSQLAAEGAFALGTGGATEGIGRAVEGGILERVLPKAATSGIEAMEDAGLHATAQAAIKSSPSIAAQLGARAANYGVQGMLQASPEAGHQLLEGDPEAAAEALLWGGGVGALLGGVGRLGGLAMEGGATRMTSVLDHPEAYERMKDAFEAGAERLGKVGMEAAGTGVGGVLGHGFGVGAWIGHTVGHGMSEEVGGIARKLAEAATDRWGEHGFEALKTFFKTAASSPYEMQFGHAAQMAGNNVALQAIARIPQLISQVAAEEELEQPKKKESKRSLDEKYELAEAIIQQAQGKQDEVTHMASPLMYARSPELSVQLGLKANNAVDYLSTLLPPPQLAKPFQPLKLVVSAQKKKEVIDAFQAIEDPIGTIARGIHGKASMAEIKAINAVYPKHMQMVGNAVTEFAGSPKAPALPYRKRQAISRLTGGQTDVTLSDPSLQAGFGGGHDEGEKEKKMSVKGLPSQGTVPGNLSAGLPGQAK